MRSRCDPEHSLSKFGRRLEWDPTGLANEAEILIDLRPYSVGLALTWRAWLGSPRTGVAHRMEER